MPEAKPAKTALTDAACRNALPRTKVHKLVDGQVPGLYLLIKPNGSKLWRLRYWLPTEKTLALGAYPAVSLKEARQKATEARRLVAEGRDPVLQKQTDILAVREQQANGFEVVARQWLTKHAKEYTAAHVLDCEQRLVKHVFPVIGKLPLVEIQPATVATLIKGIQAKGVAHMASRCHTMISQVYR